ncbi:MAG: protein kinase [Myxococcota bacterium]|nr:protein kinase [Myxococcota bacterium]
MQLDAGSVVGQYTVEAILGQGGMAIVYRVRHNQLGTEYALKVLTVSSASIRARLLQEGRVQAGLRHPNIVTVTDVVMMGENPGLVMEYIKGPSLDDFLAKKTLAIEHAEDIAEKIIRGVAAAHKAGLIHRDLKPANIMLDISHGQLTPKITDFGLSKILDSDSQSGQTRSGIAMGTPRYMSPEQIRDAKSVDSRTDIFALGGILYELICGRKTFPSDDMLQTFTDIAQGNYPKPSEIRSEIPLRLEEAIDGCLEPDKEKRISSCETLLAVWRGEDPEHTDPSVEVGGLWTDELLAEAASMSSETELQANSSPTMDLPTSQETWTAPIPGQSSPSHAELSKLLEKTAPTLQPDMRGEDQPLYTSLNKDIPAFEEPNTPTKTRSFKAIGLGVALLISAGAGAAIWMSQAPPTTPEPTEVTSNTEVAPAEVPAEEQPSASIEASPETPVASEPAVEKPARTEPASAAPSTSSPASNKRARNTQPKKATTEKTAKPKRRAKARSNGTKKSQSSAPPTRSRANPTTDSSSASKASSTAASAPATPQAVKKVTNTPATKTPRSSGPPPGMAWVKLTGDTANVYLQSASGNYRPGDDIPAGTYRLQVFFEANQPRNSGKITLSDGEVRKIKCTKALVVCR